MLILQDTFFTYSTFVFDYVLNNFFNLKKTPKTYPLGFTNVLKVIY